MATVERRIEVDLSGEGGWRRVRAVDPSWLFSSEVDGRFAGLSQ